MKSIYWIVIALVVVFAGLGYYLLNSTLGVVRPAYGGSVTPIDVQTPHPYPNSNIGRTIVWSSTLQQPNSTSIRLHFNRFEVIGEVNTPAIYEEKDYGECNLTAPPGYGRELIDPNTMRETQIIEQIPGSVSTGSSRLIKCGIVQEKKEFTPEEIFNNGWVTGDFVLVKDDQGEIIDILYRSSVTDYNNPPESYVRTDTWQKTYYANPITLELYADEVDNGYGLYIDQSCCTFDKEQVTGK